MNPSETTPARSSRAMPDEAHFSLPQRSAGRSSQRQQGRQCGPQCPRGHKLARREAGENVLFENPQLRGVDRFPARRVDFSASDAQMVARLKKPRQRCGVDRDDSVGARETPQKMRAELALTHAGCDTREGILAIKAEHGYRLTR